MKKLLIIIVVLFLSGCTQTDNKNPVASAELESFIPKTVVSFDGILDYTHTITPAYEKSFNGEITDLAGDPIIFNLSYVLEDSYLKEMYYTDTGSKLYFSSIIPEKIILSSPLEVGSSWEQSFIHNSQNLTAKSTLIKIELSIAGKRLFTTRTEIFGVKGYKNDHYRELTVFEEGFGPIYFEKSLELVKNQNGLYEEIGFDFYYQARGKEKNAP